MGLGALFSTPLRGRSEWSSSKLGLRVLRDPSHAQNQEPKSLADYPVGSRLSECRHPLCLRRTLQFGFIASATQQAEGPQSRPTPRRRHALGERARHDRGHALLHLFPAQRC